MEVENKLRTLGYELPPLPVPGGTHVAAVRVGNLLYLSGNIGRIKGELRYTGKVGSELTVEQGYEVARDCALNHLAVIKSAVDDLDRVEQIVKLTAFINGAPGFNTPAGVSNGASDLYVKLWGDRGQHARSSVVVAGLAGDSPVEIEAIVQVKG